MKNEYDGERKRGREEGNRDRDRGRQIQSRLVFGQTIGLHS